MKFTNILNVSFYVVALVLHCFGFSLLIQLKDSSRLMCTQRLYLLHISICEIFGCLIFIIIRALIELEKLEAAVIFYKMSVSGLYTWYIGLMVLMTFDRFLTVYYNIRYPLIWTSTKTKALLTVLCSSSLFFGVALLPISLDQVNKIVTLYLWTFLDLMFLVVAIVTYWYFFIKIKKNRKQSESYRINSCAAQTKVSDSRNSQSNASLPDIGTSISTTAHSNYKKKRASWRKASSEGWRTKLKKSFYTPTLLVATFVVFWLVPDQINFWNSLLWKYHQKQYVSKTIKEVLRNFYPIGYISDAIIYIFFQREVFVLLKKTMRCSSR